MLLGLIIQVVLGFLLILLKRLILSCRSLVISTAKSLEISTEFNHSGGLRVSSDWLKQYSLSDHADRFRLVPSSIIQVILGFLSDWLKRYTSYPADWM